MIATLINEAPPVMPVNTRELLDCLQETLSGWLPVSASVCCVGASMSFPIPDEERAVVSNAVPSRQAEFVAGRWCAHQALNRIGYPAPTIERCPLGGPIWPDGVAGSITHESGICMAAAVPAVALPKLGIDLFDCRRETDMVEIAGLVASNCEMGESGLFTDQQFFLKLLFSAKESVVKAVSQEAGRFLDMRDIKLTMKEDGFVASLTGWPRQFQGRWSRIGPFLLTMATQIITQGEGI